MKRALCVALLACASSAPAYVGIEIVTVGNEGNVGENSGAQEPGGSGPDCVCGAVDYSYNIGKFEVTAGQYTEFLNAVASTDAYGLYNPSMDSNDIGCQITRNGNAGSYTYDFSGRPSGTEADWSDRPVNLVSWGDAARFANWLHNGQPAAVLTGDPTQDAWITEDGSYFLNGALSIEDLLAVTRKNNATWVIPSEDEWYKAAYHYNNGATGNYYDYPTSNDSPPLPEGCPGGGNSANYFDSGFVEGPPFYRIEESCYVSSDSPYGTFHQGGNVWEWSEAVLFGLFRGIRGGSFTYSGSHMHAAYRSYVNPAHEGNGVGFRVAAIGLSPVPTVSQWGLAVMTLLLLTAGTLVYARRWEVAT